MIYDYCIIGGGIVGLATAMALLERQPGASLLILEKEISRKKTYALNDVNICNCNNRGCLLYLNASITSTLP